MWKLICKKKRRVPKRIIKRLQSSSFTLASSLLAKKDSFLSQFIFNKQSIKRWTQFRSECKCNVHQSAPKFRSRTKKSANQNGRPGRSLKWKKREGERTKKEETPPQTKRRTRRERPKSAPYLRLKNIQGTTIVKIWKKNFSKKLFLNFFFEKKYFLSRKMPKNSKKGHSGSFNVFYKPKISKKMQGGTLW